ncbi:MAG: glycosyltransferase [Cyclobacteriaceae bacterium]
MDWLLFTWYCWLGLASTSLIIILIQAIVILRYRPQINAVPIPVSIVVAARNEAEKLPTLIESIMNQKHGHFDLQIVLDRCTDDSLEIMKRLEARYENLKTIIVDYLPEHFSPKKFALTLGIKGAKQECVLLTDADCLPTGENWVSSMSSVFDNSTNFVLGYSPYNKTSGWLNRVIDYETFITGFNYISNTLLGSPSMAVGRNIVIRKSFFLSINGYNKYQHIQGGDDDLLIQHHASKKFTRVMWVPESQTSSPAKTNWSDYYFQKIRHFSVGKYYKRTSKLSHSINWIINLLLWVSFFILAILSLDFYPLYIGFFLYHFMKGLTYWLVKRRMSNGYSTWSFLILELVQLVLTPVFVIGARVTTKVKWK